MTSLVFGCEADHPILYVRDGQAIRLSPWCSLAAREAHALDEISQRFQITWEERW